MTDTRQLSDMAHLATRGGAAFQRGRPWGARPRPVINVDLFTMTGATFAPHPHARFLALRVHLGMTA